MAETTINHAFKWKKVNTTGTMPRLRRCHSACLYRDSIYIYGGYVEESSCENDFHVLNLKTLQWTQIEQKGTIPSPRAYHAACFVGSKMYTFGGASYSRVRNMEVHAFDTETNTWEEIKTPDNEKHPLVRCGHRVFVSGRSVFMFGGSDDDVYYNDLWRFDTETKIWHPIETTGALPLPRNSFSLTVVDDDVYMFGGQIKGKFETNDFYRLNLSSLHWTRLYEQPKPPPDAEIEGGGDNNNNNQDDNGRVIDERPTPATSRKSKEAHSTIPLPRADHAAVVINSRIYLFGGFKGQYPQSHRYKDLHCFDAVTQKFRPVKEQHGDVPFGMSGHTTTLYGNKLFLFGGFAGTFETINENVYMLELPQTDLTLVDLCVQLIREKDLYSVSAHSSSSDIKTGPDTLPSAQVKLPRDLEELFLC